MHLPAANIGAAVDAITSGLQRVWDNSTLQLLWLPSATTAITLTGRYVESQG